MSHTDTLDRLENRLNHLVSVMLSRKKGQVDFLIGLNRLDDIVIDLSDGRPVAEALTQFLTSHGDWLEDGCLDTSQRKRLGTIFNRLVEGLLDHRDSDHFKLAEEIKAWSQKLGTGSLKLTFKSRGEQASLADRYHSLLRREAEEINILLTERGHLLTCLDDILFSAESKNDKFYHHLAATLIYFLKLEGYKIDPYVKRLRQLREGL